MNGKIYGIFNKQNKKLYIGQTTQEIFERYKQHTYNIKTNQNMVIAKAIKKYGEESFSLIEFESGIRSMDELNSLEEYYIKNLNTLVPNGYNLCPGGNSWKRRPGISVEDLDKAVLEYVEDGKSFRYLSEKYKTNHKRLSEAVKDRGYEVRDRSHNLPDRTSKITEEIMYELYIEKNLMIKEIAEQLGVSTKTVNRAKRRYNLHR